MIENDPTPGLQGTLSNVKLDPKSTWDPTDEELEINFDLNNDVRSLIIELENKIQIEIQLKFLMMIMLMKKTTTVMRSPTATPRCLPRLRKLLR